MAGSAGRGSKIYLDGLRGDNFLNSINGTVTVDMLETTVFNSSGTKQYTNGNVDATMSAGGLWEGSSSESDSFFQSLVSSTTPKVLNWYPNNDTLGNFGIGMQIFEANYNIDSPIDGIVSVSVDGQAQSGKFSVESLRALSSAASTGILSDTTISGTADDNAAASTKGGIGWYQRTDNTTAGISSFIQHSANNSTWDTLITFTTGSTRTGQRVATSGTVKRYTRARFIIDATTSKVTQTNFGFTRF